MSARTIPAAAMAPGKLYLAATVDAPRPAKAKRGRPLRELLAAPFETLTPREQARVYRYHGGGR